MSNTPLKQQADTLITDLQLLQCYSSPSPVPSLASPIPSLHSLQSLLTCRNSRYSYSNEQRDRDQGWVVGRRADLRTLMARVDEQRGDLRHREEQRVKEEHSYFYVGDALVDRQGDYVARNFQYMLFSAVQATLTSGTHSNIPKNKRKKLKNLNFQLPNPNPNIIPNPSTKQAKSELKAQAYLKAIEQLFITEQKPIDKPFALAFKSATKLKLWQILDNFLPKPQKRPPVDPALSPEIQLYKMALESLRMVQSQFNASLPSNYESIVYYLTTNYLRKIPGKYETQGTLGPVWGVAYLLYKTGRKREFYQYLPDADLRNMFREVDESIMVGKPQRLMDAEENGDIFHDQLVYALSGQSKYSSDVLCDPGTLDIAWVFLRSVGIFPDRQQKFQQLQKDLALAYKTSSTNETKIKNLLYLLCFDELVQIGPNELMDEDDYLHFLICLYWISALRGLCLDLGKLEHRLTERLAECVQDLLAGGRKQSVYYIAMVPSANLPKQISTIVCTTKQLQTLKWKELEKYLDKAVYSQLITLTCSKYVDVHQSYILAAEKVCELLGDWEQGLVFLVKMGVRGGADDREKARGNRLAKEILDKNQRLKLEYGPVFQFFTQHNTLLTLLQSRNENKLSQFLKSSSHILITPQPPLHTQKLLHILTRIESTSGFDYYIQYMIDIVRAYEIALTKLDKLHDLQEVRRLTLGALAGLVGGGDWARFGGTEAVGLLLDLLEQGLYSYG